MRKTSLSCLRSHLTLMIPIGLLLTCGLGSPVADGETVVSSPSPSVAGPVTEMGVPQVPATAAATAAVTCTHYVAPNGDDNYSGTTTTQPWATFQHAADSAQPGDTICFRGGTYFFTEEAHLTQSGTAGATITFIAYLSETPVLDGGGSVGGLLILDQYTSYVRISGFTLRNFTIWGMELSGENRHV